MGMDIVTFYHLTPDEFEQVYEKWSDSRDAEYKNKWEQTRLICYYAIRPNLKGNPKVTTFMKFPWEKAQGRGHGAEVNASTGSAGSAEKIHDPERFERLKKKYGGTI
jgi:hypothetical protein